MNTPYVKESNKFGQVTNFPKGGFVNKFPNRKQRRLQLGSTKTAPSSTKIAKCSADNNRVIRTNKHLRQPDNNYFGVN